jgi:hypothetical protein
MRYVNTKTGAETNEFSQATWDSGVPQRAGWIETLKPSKTTPKDIVNFVFKKKPVEEAKPKELIDFEVKPKKYAKDKSMEIAPPAIEEVEILEVKQKVIPLIKKDKVAKPKTKKNDNPKQKRRASGNRNA